MTSDNLYDQFNYQSVPFPDTHPRHLACLGRLFELPTADPERCRVLELGCASGGNLLPMAWYHPDASFIGIDLSSIQIQRGCALVERLGLNNLELRQGDILMLGEELGGFDYIIAHGVYSWVATPVREQLLRLSRSLLRPAGLLYLSFNTLPGWRMRGMLRDLLLYACRDTVEVRSRLDTAYAALTRLERALDGLDALSARYLREEINYLRSAHPSYLLFEYLAEENNAFLFADFLTQLMPHRLRYLCDTQLSFLFPSSFGTAVEAALADIERDMELEQWLDFVSARNFRRCVICRDDATPADELSLDAFAEFSFGCDLTAPQRVDLRQHKPAQFHQPDGSPIEVTHPLTKALLLEMIEQQPSLLHLQQLLPGAEQRLRSGGADPRQQAYDLCLMELFSLFSHRALSAAPNSVHLKPTSRERPMASGLARAQVADGQARIATARHTSLDLDSFAARLIHYLDGASTEAELTRLLLTDLANGTLIPPDGTKMQQWSAETREKKFRQSCSELLNLFSRQGILL